MTRKVWINYISPEGIHLEEHLAPSAPSVHYSRRQNLVAASEVELDMASTFGQDTSASEAALDHNHLPGPPSEKQFRYKAEPVSKVDP